MPTEPKSPSTPESAKNRVASPLALDSLEQVCGGAGVNPQITEILLTGPISDDQSDQPIGDEADNLQETGMDNDQLNELDIDSP